MKSDIPARVLGTLRFLESSILALLREEGVQIKGHEPNGG